MKEREKPRARREIQRQAPSEKARAFEDLGLEVRRLFHRLKLKAEQIHEDPDGLSASHRAILEGLDRGGSTTVPEFARGRSVTRQHVQVLVNRLVELGLVEPLPNPAHQRSVLIRLTETGRKRFRAMQDRERRTLETLEIPVSPGAMRGAAETLAQIRKALESS